MPLLCFSYSALVLSRKRLNGVNSSFLVVLVINDAGRTSKFFFLLKIGREVQISEYEQSSMRVIPQSFFSFSFTMAPPSVFSFDMFEMKLPKE